MPGNRKSAEELALSLVGQHENASVLGVDHIVEYSYGSRILKKFYMKCRCNCGNEFVRDAPHLNELSMCRSCMIQSRRSSEKDLSGKKFGNLTVLSRNGAWLGTNRTLWNVRCALCGQESVIDGAHLGVTKSCKCQREKGLKIGKEFAKALRVGGTFIPALTDRRKLNGNSSTGHRGVSLIGKNHRCRAYITFRHKQYHLGCYSKIEDAISARKEAESRIYGDFLAWYAATYPDVWKKLQAKNEKL